MRQRDSLSSGFTLLEALIVLAIFGLIVVGTLPLIRLATDQVARARTADLSTQEVASLDAVLWTILARAQPPTRGRTELEMFPFVGTSVSVQFLAPVPKALGGGFATYSLALTRAGDSQRLTLNWRRTGEPETEVNLVSDVASVTFAYQVGDPAQGKPLVWVDQVNGATERVHAVRLKVTSDSVGALERFVPLLIDRNRNCVFDTVAFDCRPGT